MQSSPTYCRFSLFASTLICILFLMNACSGREDLVPYLEEEAPALANAFPTPEKTTSVVGKDGVVDPIDSDPQAAEPEDVQDAYPVNAMGVDARSSDEAVVDAYPVQAEAAYPAPADNAVREEVSAENDTPTDAYPAPDGTPDLPDLPEPDTPPFISNVFSGLVFKNSSGLFLVDINGSILQLMTPPDRVTWPETPLMPSPSMHRVAMIKDGELAIHNLVDDSTIIPLPTSYQLECCYLQWLDEERLMVGVREAGNEGANAGVAGIFNIVTEEILLLSDIPNFSQPALSPDGTQVALSEGGAPLVKMLSGEQTAFSSPPELSKTWSAAWNRDGSQIAWLGQRNTDEMVLAIIDSEGNSAEFHHPYTAIAPEWQPAAPAWQANGSLVAFETIDVDPARFGIWMVDSITGEETYIAPGSNPHWQPAGRQLAYETPNGIVLYDLLNQDYLLPQLQGNIITWVTPPTGE